MLGCFPLESQSLFYWITYSYNWSTSPIVDELIKSQSLFYWITYSYGFVTTVMGDVTDRLNPYFIGLPILISTCSFYSYYGSTCLNPYFIGLPILIHALKKVEKRIYLSQSLFYWITYSYKDGVLLIVGALIRVSILILLDYLFLFETNEGASETFEDSLNPYFIGLPILIST